MKKNIVKDKSFDLTIRIVRLNQYLVSEKKEFVLSKQLLQSRTSVGAMVREAEQAESKKDFVHKMVIAQKEMNETIYWLELLQETDYLTQEQFESINKNSIEIIRLVTSIIKTTKSKINN